MIQKVNFFSKYVNYPVISDDSGLCIMSLKKKPGIYSARWGGKSSDFNKAMQRVYKELDKKDKYLNFEKNHKLKLSPMSMAKKIACLSCVRTLLSSESNPMNQSYIANVWRRRAACKTNRARADDRVTLCSFRRQNDVVIDRVITRPENFWALVNDHLDLHRISHITQSIPKSDHKIQNVTKLKQIRTSKFKNSKAMIHLTCT